MVWISINPDCLKLTNHYFIDSLEQILNDWSNNFLIK